MPKRPAVSVPLSVAQEVVSALRAAGVELERMEAHERRVATSVGLKGFVARVAVVQDVARQLETAIVDMDDAIAGYIRAERVSEAFKLDAPRTGDKTS